MKRAFAIGAAAVAAVACADRVGTSTRTGKEAGSIRGKALLLGATDHSGIAVALSGPGTALAVTGADGAYTFEGLNDGTYRIQISPTSTIEPDRVLVSTIEKASAQTIEDVTFTAAGKVTGRAMLNGDAAGNTGIVVGVAGAAGSALTDDGGRYALVVPAGTRQIVASFSGYRPAVAMVEVTHGGATAAPDLELEPAIRSGDFGGRALLKCETNHAGITVAVVGTELTATTDAEGNYAFTGVPEGLYRLRFGKAGFADEEVENVPALAATGRFEVPPVELRRARRIAAGTVQGATVSPDGTRVAWVDGSARLWIAPAAGGERKLLAGWAMTPVYFSSDGGRVTFWDGVQSVIYALAADGTGAAATLAIGATVAGANTLSSSPTRANTGYASGPREAPRPTFVADRWVYQGAADRLLRSVSVAGGDPVQIDAAQVTDATVSPDGARVAYHLATGGALKLSPTASSSPVVLSTDATTQFVFTPDSTRAVFVATVSAGHEARSALLGSGDPQPAALFSMSDAFTLYPLDAGTAVGITDGGALFAASLAQAGATTELATSALFQRIAAGRAVYGDGLTGDLYSRDAAAAAPAVKLASAAASVAASDGVVLYVDMPVTALHDAGTSRSGTPSKLYALPAEGGTPAEVAAPPGLWQVDAAAGRAAALRSPPLASKTNLDTVAAAAADLYTFALATPAAALCWDDQVAWGRKAGTRLVYGRASPDWPDLVHNGLYLGALP